VGQRFTVSEVLTRTFELYRSWFPQLLLLGVVAHLPIALVQLVPAYGIGRGAAAVVTVASALAAMLVGAFLEGVIVHGTYEGLSGRNFDVSRSLRFALDRLWIVFGVSLVSIVLTMLGLVLLVVPGLVIVCTLWVAVSAAVVERRGVTAALVRSRELTAGRRLRILGLVVVAWCFAGVVSVAVVFLWRLVAALGVPHWGEPLLDTVGTALSSIFSALVGTVSYYYLRMDAEGVDVDGLAAVFD